MILRLKLTESNATYVLALVQQECFIEGIMATLRSWSTITAVVEPVNTLDNLDIFTTFTQTPFSRS